MEEEKRNSKKSKITSKYTINKKAIKKNILSEIMEIYCFLYQNKERLDLEKPNINNLIKIFTYKKNKEYIYKEKVHLSLINFIIKKIFLHKTKNTIDLKIISILENNKLRGFYRDYLLKKIWPKIILELIFIFRDLDKEESNYLLKKMEEIDINNYNNYRSKDKLRFFLFLIKIFVNNNDNIYTNTFLKKKLGKIYKKFLDLRKKKKKFKELKNFEEIKKMDHLINKKTRKLYFKYNQFILIGIDSKENNYWIFHKDIYNIYKEDKKGKFSVIKNFQKIIKNLELKKDKKKREVNFLQLLKNLKVNKILEKRNNLFKIENNFDKKILEFEISFKKKIIFKNSKKKILIHCLYNEFNKILENVIFDLNFLKNILKEIILIFSKFLDIEKLYFSDFQNEEKLLDELEEIRNLQEFNKYFLYIKNNFKKVIQISNGNKDEKKYSGKNLKKKVLRQEKIKMKKKIKKQKKLEIIK